MRRLPVLLCGSVLALGVTGCGTAIVSTGAFKGERHDVAQAISNLQSDASAGEEKKLCADDLASAVVARLGGAKRCEAAIKSQLSEVDSLEVSVLSVQLGAAGKSKPTGKSKPAGKSPAAGKGTAGNGATAGEGVTAQAQVRSVHSGKMKPSTVLLVKEGGRWKISGVG